MIEKQRVHGTSVAYKGKSILIIGRPGTGKSSVAFRLIALGSELVADDSVDLCRDGNVILTRCPDTIKGMIEARGLGILQLPHCTSAELQLVVDMDKTEVRRLPEEKTKDILGIDISLVFGGNCPHIADIVFCMFKGWTQD